MQQVIGNRRQFLRRHAERRPGNAHRRNRQVLRIQQRHGDAAQSLFELSSLALVMENDWYKVSRGLLTEDEINSLHMEMKRQKLQATIKSFPDSSLPLKKQLLARADTETKSYVQMYFNGG